MDQTARLPLAWMAPMVPWLASRQRFTDRVWRVCSKSSLAGALRRQSASPDK